MAVDLRLEGIFPWNREHSTGWVQNREEDTHRSLEKPETGMKIERSYSCSDCSRASETFLANHKRNEWLFHDLVYLVIGHLGHEEYNSLSLVSRQWHQGVFSVRKYKAILYLNKSFDDLYSLFDSKELLSGFYLSALSQVFEAKKVNELMRAFYASELYLCNAYIEARNNSELLKQGLTCGPSRLIQELSQSLIRIDRWNSERRRCRYLACAALKMVLSGHMGLGSVLMQRVSSPFLKDWVAQEVLTHFLDEHKPFAALKFISELEEARMQRLLGRFFRLLAKQSQVQRQEPIERTLILSNGCDAVVLHFVARPWLLRYVELLDEAKRLFSSRDFWNETLVHALEELGYRALALGELENALEVAVHLRASNERKCLFGAISRKIRKQVRFKDRSTLGNVR